HVGEALAHYRFVRRSLLLPCVRLHLRVNEDGDLLRVENEGVANLVIVLEVRAQVRNDLARQLVEQVRLLIVAYVVEVGEPPHDVVLEPLFSGATGERTDDVLRAALEVLDEDLLRDRLEAERRKVQGEVTEA